MGPTPITAAVGPAPITAAVGPAPITAVVARLVKGPAGFLAAIRSWCGREGGRGHACWYLHLFCDQWPRRPLPRKTREPIDQIAMTLPSHFPGRNDGSLPGVPAAAGETASGASVTSALSAVSVNVTARPATTSGMEPSSTKQTMPGNPAHGPPLTAKGSNASAARAHIDAPHRT